MFEPKTHFLRFLELSTFGAWTFFSSQRPKSGRVFFLFWAIRSGNEAGRTAQSDAAPVAHRRSQSEKLEVQEALVERRPSDASGATSVLRGIIGLAGAQKTRMRIKVREFRGWFCFFGGRSPLSSTHQFKKKGQKNI